MPIGRLTPTHVELFTKVCYTKGAPEGRIFIGNRQYFITLRVEALDQAYWIEHEKGKDVDLAAFPTLQLESDDERFLCLNEVGLSPWWSPSVSSSCYIVGFPEGLQGDFGTPIWKRGSIATEPEVNHGGLPCLLVDSLTNPAMSGSPVIAQSDEIFRENVPDGTIGPWRSLCGVYSGRLGDAGVGFQLGRVWKAELIKEMFLRQRIGQIPPPI
jgi:hypothetical protein